MEVNEILKNTTDDNKKHLELCEVKTSLEDSILKFEKKRQKILLKEPCLATQLEFRILLLRSFAERHNIKLDV